MNYYSFHIGDYRRDTAHLSLLEHGVYRQLIDMYCLSEQKIPEETELVYRRLCAKTKEEKNAVDTVLSEFFIREDGWFHVRCDLEIKEYQAKAGRARENGKLGGRPHKTNVVIPSNPEKSESQANQEPITNNQKKEEKKSASAPTIPEIPDSLMADFLKVRKAKKAPLTETAIEGIRREAGKAGVSMVEAITACVENGWQGFKADWYAERQTKSTQHQVTETTYQRSMRLRVAEISPELARPAPGEQNPTDFFRTVGLPNPTILEIEK